MIEQDYVDFCNFAHGLRERAEKFFARLGDDRVRQLGDLVRNEVAACAGGKVEPAYDFLATILVEEVAKRENPSKNIAEMPRRFPDGIPF